MKDRTALLLLGSPRTPSNSGSLGEYLCARLADQGWNIETAIARRASASPEGIEGLFEMVQRAELVIVATPLYVDALPAPLVRVLEELAARRKGGAKAQAYGHAGEPPRDGQASCRQRLAAIVNCGFPEARQNEFAISVCELFARDANFEWAGALALGAGEMLGRKPLDGAGGPAQGIKRALDTAAAALAAGRPIPAEAIQQMAKPAIPRWMYVSMGNWGWRWQARQSGVGRQLRARPYAPQAP